MAMVYVAEDLKHHRKVAVKVLRPELAGGGSRWSPDGRFIAYIGGRSLKLISPAGGEPRTLVDVQDSLAQPVAEKVAWSLDSRLVYFVAHDARGQAGLWSVALTGGAPRRRVRFDDPAADFGRGRFAVKEWQPGLFPAGPAGERYLDRRGADASVVTVTRPSRDSGNGRHASRTPAGTSATIARLR